MYIFACYGFKEILKLHTNVCGKFVELERVIYSSSSYYLFMEVEL